MSLLSIVALAWIVCFILAVFHQYWRGYDITLLELLLGLSIAPLVFRRILILNEVRLIFLGNVGDDGKFYFEIFISFLGSGEPKSLGMFGPWETKEISEKAMWNAIKICCEQAGYKSGSYIDMKTNQTKSFEE